ncbi:MAG: hypothetical protein OEW88_07045, partial [Gammaproteobacteria bacterium]|nr:hypothetical protein [Gammaproteobacteria bacterium]
PGNRHYEIVREVAFVSNNTGCLDDTETRRKGIIAVVEELFDRMQADGTRALLTQPAPSVTVTPAAAE